VSYNSGSTWARYFKSASRSANFEITRPITPWIVLHSVELLLLIIFLNLTLLHIITAAFIKSLFLHYFKISQNLIIHFLTYNITVSVICVILANIRKRAFLLVIKVLAFHVEILLELQRRLFTSFSFHKN